MAKAFDIISKSVSKETKKYVEKNLDISEEVRLILSKHRSIKTQKQLAEALGKKQSEISRWLSGLSNISLESITKMEAVLGEDIIVTPSKFALENNRPVINSYYVLKVEKTQENLKRFNSGSSRGTMYRNNSKWINSSKAEA